MTRQEWAAAKKLREIRTCHPILLAPGRLVAHMSFDLLAIVDILVKAYFTSVTVYPVSGPFQVRMHLDKTAIVSRSGQSTVELNLDLSSFPFPRYCALEGYHLIHKFIM